MEAKQRGRADLKIVVAVVLLAGLAIVTSGNQEPVRLPPQTSTSTTGNPSNTTGNPSNSTGTSANTTGTTAGTTGSTAGNEEGASYLLLQQIEERLNAKTEYLQGNAITTGNNNRHVCRIKFKCPYIYTSTGDYNNGTSHVIKVTAVAVPAGSEIGGDTLPSAYVSTVNNETCAQVDWPNLNAAWDIWLQRGSNATLNGGQLRAWVYAYSGGEGHYTDGTGRHVTSIIDYQGWFLLDITIDKILLEAISIDDRKVFGKANLDGEIPGDANADQSNNNFQPWDYKGGLFSGIMASGSRDLSGKARAQFRLQNPTTEAANYLAGCVTTFATTIRGDFSPGAIGLYRPAATDANLNQGLNAIWGNGFALLPGGTQSGPGDYTKQPYDVVTPLTTVGVFNGQGNYLNWQMPSRSNVYKTAYGGDGNPDHNNMWTHFALCQNTESDPNPTTVWQYFSSQWAEAIPGQQFPLSDSRPRIWKVRYSAN